MKRIIEAPFPTVTISPYDNFHGFGGLIGTSAPTSTTHPSANRALLIPFRLFRPVTAYKMFMFNGSAVSGNLDLGIYDTAGKRLGSTGSTVQSGTNTIQEVALTAPVLLDAGFFFMALAMDNTVGTTLRRGINNDICEAFGIAHMNAAFPLPVTATFTSPSASNIPYMGVNFFNV